MKTARYCLFICLPLFTGCATMYIPSPKNIPLFEEKGEVQVETGVTANSIFATGNYAFSEKYAVIANGSLSFGNFSEIYDLADLHQGGGETNYLMFGGVFAHHSVEAGVGKYKIPLSGWNLELFGGGGYGNAKGGDHKNEYWLGFIQGNIGKRFKAIELGWSLRVAFSEFYFTYPSRIYQSKDYFDVKFNNFHLEPLFCLRTGYGLLHGFVRGGLSITSPLKPLWEIDSTEGVKNGILEYTIFHLSIGVSFRL